MSRLVVIHPPNEGENDNDVRKKLLKRINIEKGNILIVEHESYVFDECEKDKIKKPYELLETSWDNFGWVVFLTDYFEDSFIKELSQSLINKNITSLEQLTEQIENEYFGKYYKEISKIHPDIDDSDDFYELLVKPFNKAITTFKMYLNEGDVLIGGSIDSCLKEVAFMYDLMGISYTIDYPYTYKG